MCHLPFWFLTTKEVIKKIKHSVFLPKKCNFQPVFTLRPIFFAARTKTFFLCHWNLVTPSYFSNHELKKKKSFKPKLNFIKQKGLEFYHLKRRTKRTLGNFFEIAIYFLCFFTLIPLLSILPFLNKFELIDF